MKKFLLSACLGMVAVSTFAGGYVPMIKEGYVWEYSGYTFKYGGAIATHKMRFSGERTVNGKTYTAFELFETIYALDDSSEIIAEQRIGPRWYLREEPGKLYALTADHSLVTNNNPQDGKLNPEVEETEYTELKLYDFTLEDGGELPQVNFGHDERLTINIFNLQPIEIEGKQCKVQLWDWYKRRFNKEPYIADLSDSRPYLVEGIGVTYNGCLPYFCHDLVTGMPENGDLPNAESGLKCVRNPQGEVIYQIPAYNDVQGIVMDLQSAETVYDVMGRQVKETVPGSIYIRGGKKFVAK